MSSKPPCDDWAMEIEDVEPLKSNRLNPKETPKGFEKYAQKTKENHPEFATFTIEDDEEIKEISVVLGRPKTSEPFKRIQISESLFCAARAGIDEKTFKKLKNGQIPYESVLDLHGMVEEAAWQDLMQFIDQAYLQQLKCVLVVHGKGKGYGEQGKMGLLKSQTPAWLMSHSAVLAFHTTLPKHGGSGAVYVLLRRMKNK